MRSMKTSETCDRCGGADIIAGKISRASFVSHEGLRSFLSEGVGMEAVACLTCGGVSFWADPIAIRKMLTDPPV